MYVWVLSFLKVVHSYDFAVLVSFPFSLFFWKRDTIALNRNWHCLCGKYFQTLSAASIFRASSCDHWLNRIWSLCERKRTRFRQFFLQIIFLRASERVVIIASNYFPVLGEGDDCHLQFWKRLSDQIWYSFNLSRISSQAFNSLDFEYTVTFNIVQENEYHVQYRTAEI
jgi:hypothetical protein